MNYESVSDTKNKVGEYELKDKREFGFGRTALHVKK
jgi:hypothetical protein